MLVDSIELFDQAVLRLAGPGAPLLCDLETTGLEPFAKKPDTIIGFAVGLLEDPSTDCYIAVGHGEGSNVPMEYALPRLTALFRGRQVANFNLQFDLRFLLVAGFEMPPSIEDLMIMAHLCNENEESMALKALAERYLGAKAVEANQALKAELKARKLKKGDMWKLPASLVAPYAVDDIKLVRTLLPMYRELLAKWRLEQLYRERCEYRLVLTRMELEGLLLDPAEIQRQMDSIAPRLVEMQQEINELAGREVNPNSPRQLKEWLGTPNTNRATLDEMIERHQDPRALLLLEYRSLSRAKTGYFRPWLEKSGPDNRLHPNFKVSSTVTQRLACSDPNTQNISKSKKDRKYDAKQCFVPPEGYFIVEADLSQIEPRVAVHFSKDQDMMEAFSAGLDIHIRAAKQIFRRDRIDKDTDEGKTMKDAAKSLSLGTLYSLGALKIAKKLKLKHAKLADGTHGYEYHHELVWRLNKETDELEQVPCSENDHEFCTASGKGFQREYLETWPMLKPFIDKVTSNAEALKYVRTPLTGAVRRFPDKRFAYKAFNALIQMTAGEILRLAIMRFGREFTGPDAPKLVLTVHDSVVFYVKIGPDALRWVKRIKEIMETTTKLLVPTPSDVKWGWTYGNLLPMPEGWDSLCA